MLFEPLYLILDALVNELVAGEDEEVDVEGEVLDGHEGLRVSRREHPDKVQV